ncbi:hypothetical protein H257_01684 [Aphanomyces astaci]|uniref:Uncharacterized protein n=1 Tax=Aphanomyces astaci TaxID=112090 RepID=W4H4H4_APHAT|nr:hypothetical protein H257_01684 [Aphanomyces astaci]ETV86506.1 hypothetical protein H257_01684 [Aphanomyces astaci]|eukprot:XP_009823305.1 hypothetical protein H257_01684 [Aphanomyces astaci]
MECIARWGAWSRTGTILVHKYTRRGAGHPTREATFGTSAATPSTSWRRCATATCRGSEQRDQRLVESIRHTLVNRTRRLRPPRLRGCLAGCKHLRMSYGGMWRTSRRNEVRR